MIRINQVKLPIQHTGEQLIQKLCKLLKIRREELLSYQIRKKSIDARKKPELFYVYSIDVAVPDEGKIFKRVNDKNIMLTKEKKYQLPENRIGENEIPPIVIGAGPAGLFCAYALVLQGLKPLVIERGKCVEERTADVERFWETGVLDVTSNVQFGEGGAGTFSDGKLNTLVKDTFGRNRFVLETFVKFGAPEHILYENKPHIGTDILSGVIRNMRCFMEKAGAKFCFSTCMTDYRCADGHVTEIELNHTEWIPAGTIVLAIGHSARDTFQMLHEKEELHLESKSFAVGFRVEHPQKEINLGQYGELYADRLPAASYKTAVTLPDGRGVYSFCMCPGGYVVNASSQEGRLAVNGMSDSGRNGKNANSAIIVSVTPEDFSGNDALAGVRFQEMLEEKAYTLGKGRIPQQLFGDYCKNRASDAYGAYKSDTKGAHILCNLRGLLPETIETSFIEGMHRFAKSIENFDREDAILSGVESRTSSPVRIPRNETFMAAVSGIYPCGEGAGYAGGIMSAAMDGLKVAEAILKSGK